MFRTLTVIITLVCSISVFSQTADEENWFEKASEAHQLAVLDYSNRAKHLEDASYYYEREILKNGERYDTYLNWANTLADLYEATYEDKYIDQCFEKYELAVKLNPNYALSYFNWGVTLYYKSIERSNAEMMRSSIDKLARCVAIDDEFVEAQDFLGMALNRVFSSNTEFKFTQHKDLGEYETLQAKIGYLHKNKMAETEIKQAIDLYRAASITALDDYVGHYINGLFLMEIANIEDSQSRYKEAFASLYKAIEISPNYESAYTSLVYHLFDRVRDTQDLTSLNQLMVAAQEASTKDIANASIYTRWGQALLTVGQKRKDDTRIRLGLRALEQGMALDPFNAKAHLSMALAYEQLLTKDKSAETYRRTASSFEKAIELNPEDYPLHKKAGDFFLLWAYSSKNPKLYIKAAEVFEKANPLDPHNLTIVDNWSHSLMSAARLEKNFHAYRDRILSVLIKAEAMGSQEAAFNLICVYSILNEKKEALNWMETFFTKSSQYRMQMNMQRSDFTTDSDFNNIKRDPKFNSLLNVFM